MCCLSYRVVCQENVFSTVLHLNPQLQLMSGEQVNSAHVVQHAALVSQVCTMSNNQTNNMRVSSRP